MYTTDVATDTAERHETLNMLLDIKTYSGQSHSLLLSIYGDVFPLETDSLRDISMANTNTHCFSMLIRLSNTFIHNDNESFILFRLY